MRGVGDGDKIYVLQQSTKINMLKFKEKKITNIIKKGKHQEGANIVKVTKGAKVKVFSKDYI
jgi:hypothetical protein